MIPLLLLPGLSIHAPFYADSREPVSRVTVHDAGVEAGIADELAIVGQDHLSLAPGRAPDDAGLSWRVGLSAGVFMGFDPSGDLTFNLLTFDGLFGLPLDVRYGPWSFRTEWSHVSAHLADGVRFSDERPGPDEVHPYSRETVRFQAAVAVGWFRPYLGLSQIVHAADGGSGPALQAGWTADGLALAGPFAGVDFKASQEDDWVPTLGAVAGVRFTGPHRYVVRLGVTGYRGVDDAGRWRPARESYLGLQVSLHGERG